MNTFSTKLSKEVFGKEKEQQQQKIVDVLYITTTLSNWENAFKYYTLVEGLIINEGRDSGIPAIFLYLIQY